VRKLALAGVLAPCALLLLAFHFGLLPPLLIYNTSPSVPLGWWAYSTSWPPARGDYVAMRGAPLWPLPWLMKRVEGVEGDLFCWRDGRHWINDRPMPVLDPLAFDMERRVPGLSIWRGCRKLEAEEIAGFGEGGLSYGSAFFGPVPIDSLWGVYRHR